MGKFKPYKHQEDANKFLDTRKRAILYLPTGSGKTLTSLYHMKKQGFSKIVFVTLSTLVVSKQIDKECELLDMTPFSVRYSTKQRNQEEVLKWYRSNAEFAVLVISWQRFRNFMPSIGRIISDKKHKIALIYDEITNAKKVTTTNYKMARALSLYPSVDKVIGMTASIKNPFTINNVFKAVGIDIIEEDEIWQKYALYRVKKVSRYRRARLIQGFRNLQEFNKIIEPYSFVRSKQDVAKEIPPFRINVVRVKDENKAVKIIQTERIEYLQSVVPADQTVPIPYVTINETCPKTENGEIIHSEYMKTTLQLINLNETEQFLVYCRLSEEAEQLTKFLVANGINAEQVSSRVKNKMQIVEQFKRGETRVMVATSAISHGVDGLQKVCSEIIFFSPPDGWETFQQFVGRLSRIGSVEVSYINIHLLVRPNTLSEGVWKINASACSLIRKLQPENIDKGLDLDSALEITALNANEWTKETVGNMYKGKALPKT